MCIKENSSEWTEANNFQKMNNLGSDSCLGEQEEQKNGFAPTRDEVN